jgi:hypothetical protein
MVAQVIHDGNRDEPCEQRCAEAYSRASGNSSPFSLLGTIQARSDRRQDEDAFEALTKD